MATIYRFIVEQKTSDTGNGGMGGKARSTKGAGKKGKDLPILGIGSRGGVEHNRKMRAINPILNKVTGGIWEKSMRLGRASLGLVKKNTQTGKISFSGPSIAIIIAFVLMTVWNGIAKLNQRDRQIAQKNNAQNFKAMENGSGTIHGAYLISTSAWSGRITYNENK